jgi:CheY-like chemotaxis protein
MLVWLVDDDHDNHEVARATVEGLGGFLFHGFHSGHAALEAFAQGGRPEVVLMDFYLGAERGDRITARLRALADGRRPLVVGYSSLHSGSERIVTAGGDVIVPKRCDAGGTNPHLRRFLAQLRSQTAHQAHGG